MESTIPKNIMEQELILSCARTRIGPEVTARVGQLFGQDLNWEYLLNVSRQNGVSPLLYKSFKTLGQHAMPPWVMEQLQQHYYFNLAHNLRLEVELTSLLDRFRAHDIPAIPFKGPALAKSIYGSSALRVFGDLDIIIPKEYAQRVTDVMSAGGYQPEVQLDAVQLPAYVDAFYELTFTASGKAPVEVHWEIYADHFAFPIARLAIWHDHKGDRCQSGCNYVTAEKLLLMLCVHGTQHYWERLSWICDMAELLRKHRDFDWDGLLNMATETGGQRMLFLGLTLAHQLLDAPIPDEILSRITKDRTVKKCVQTMRSRLFQTGRKAPGVLETCLFYVKMRERVRDKARVCFRTFSRPVPGEWERLGLNGFRAQSSNVIRHALIGFGYGLELARQRLRN